MTAPDAPTTRPSDVDQRLARVTAGLCRDHPACAGSVRGVLAPLRDRLRRVHERGRPVDAAAWATYRADLDRGLDELSLEVARAAEQPRTGVDGVLAAAAARLELRAWQLRLHTADGTDPDVAAARALATDLEAALDRLAAAPAEVGLRARVQQHLEELRRAVQQAERP